jgi:hypothetical protein
MGCFKSHAQRVFYLKQGVKFGVEPINPEGEPFNPELHEAITMLPMPDKESNTVLDVVQVGFTLKWLGGHKTGLNLL